MKIYVVRHGLTELNKQGKVNGQIDEPLAAEGVDQVRDAVSLIPPTITCIYTSPLLRARQTAEIINSRLKLPIYQHEGIREIHMGSLAGKAWTESDHETLLVTHGGVIRVLHLLEHGQPLVNEIEHISLQIFDLDRILK